jgi:hypothetical protein
VIGAVHASFTVEKTEDRRSGLEGHSTLGDEELPALCSGFEKSGQKVLIRIVQHVELRRKHAKDLHRFAILVGESAISSEMQKRVREMIKTFLERARQVGS